jgi:hypothetical protein
MNPDFRYVWKDSEGEEEIFDGLIHKTQTGTSKVKIPTLQQRFSLVKGEYNLEVGNRIKIKLYFTLFGIRASIIEENNDNVNLNNEQ